MSHKEVLMYLLHIFISGSAKHSITLTGQDEGKGPTVKDLSDALSQATGVPSASQKLIFKGTFFF